jgi:hypothetical protein
MQVKKGRGVGILGLRLEMSYETIALFLQFVQLYAHEYEWFPVDMWDAAESTFGIDISGTPDPLLGTRTVNKHGVPTMV